MPYTIRYILSFVAALSIFFSYAHGLYYSNEKTGVSIFINKNDFKSGIIAYQQADSTYEAYQFSILLQDSTGAPLPSDCGNYLGFGTPTIPDVSGTFSTPDWIQDDSTNENLNITGAFLDTDGNGGALRLQYYFASASGGSFNPALSSIIPVANGSFGVLLSLQPTNQLSDGGVSNCIDVIQNIVISPISLTTNMISSNGQLIATGAYQAFTLSFGALGAVASAAAGALQSTPFTFTSLTSTQISGTATAYNSAPSTSYSSGRHSVTVTQTQAIIANTIATSAAAPSAPLVSTSVYMFPFFFNMTTPTFTPISTATTTLKAYTAAIVTTGSHTTTISLKS